MPESLLQRCRFPGVAGSESACCFKAKDDVRQPPVEILERHEGNQVTGLHRRAKLGERVLQTLNAVEKSNNASAFSAMNSRLANSSTQSSGIALAP
jgi:hypothetical protein